MRWSMRWSMRLRDALPAIAIVTAAGAAELGAQTARDLPAADRPLRLRTSDVYAVGRVDGPVHELFGDRVTPAFGADGTLYVLDADNHQVVVFDSAGRHLRSFGGEGGGPGELRLPLGFAVTTGERVVISDLGRRAYVVYTTAGVHVADIPFGEDGLPLGDLATHPDGGVVADLRPIMTMSRGGGAPSNGSRSRRLVHDRLTDGLGRRVLREHEPPPFENETRPRGGGGMTFVSMGPPRFFPDLRWAALPGGGLAVAEGEGWSVELLGPDGARRAELRRPLEPRPITEDDEAAYREREKRRLAEGGGSGGGSGGGLFVTTRGGGSGEGGGTVTVPEEMLERIVDGMRFHDVRPVIRELAADPEGRLWVRRDGEEIGEDGPVDVVSSDGRYLGSLPADTAVPAAFGPDGLAAWVERDELGVAKVAVRRLEL